MPDDKLPPVCQVTPDELPVWLPGDRAHREMVELIRDHWWIIKRYAETFRVLGVGVFDRLTAERGGNWPPVNLLRHRGLDYWLGEYPAACGHPSLRALLDGEPRAIRVVVSMRGINAGAPDGTAVGEYLVHLDLGPPGAWLAGGDRPPQGGEA